MRKRILLLYILFATSVIQVFANSYMAKLTAHVASASSGMGKVYVAQDNIDFDDEYNEESAEATQGSDTKGELKSFYAFAKPLSDDYEFVGWSETEGGRIVSKANPYQVDVNCSTAGSTVNAADIFANFISKAISHISLVDPENGSISATDGVNSVTGSGSLTTRELVTFAATVPDGYKVLAWYFISEDGKKTYFAYSATAQKAFNIDAAVGVEFVKESLPVFLVDGDDKPYSDLNEAFSAAKDSGIVVLVDDGELEPNEYVIPAGKTLLIPFNSEHDCYAENRPPIGIYKYEKPYRYSQLTIPNGATLTVNGTISIPARLYPIHGNDPYSGANIIGGYGCLQMDRGSSMVLNSGANLFAWGYILGEGNVLVNSGATVYEQFQLSQFRGGNGTTDMAGNSQLVFPINQYFVQNVEVPMTLLHGAKEMVCACVGVDTRVCVTDYFTFIGDDGMFILDEGASVTKHYDPSRDRQVYELDGNAQFGKLAINLLDVMILSDDYVLPLTNNLSIFIDNGTLTINNKNGLALLPDVELTIGKEAELLINGTNVFVYDSDEWGVYSGFSQFTPTYSPTCAFVRTGLEDAKIDVKGRIRVVNGGLFTTRSGANICCSGDCVGSVSFEGEKSDVVETWQATQVVPNIYYESIPVSSAQLSNVNGYTSTEDRGNDVTYYYNPVLGRWSTELVPSSMEQNSISNDVVGIYNIAGYRTENLRKGLNIVKKGNSMVKVIK